MEEKLIGKITHYYGKIGVGIIELSAPLKVGDEIHIKGHTTDFNQKIESMQIEHQNIERAKKGDVIGVKLTEMVHEGDEVYLVV